MSRKDSVDKRMRKIEKGEEKALKVLTKQRKELLRALDENDKLIQQRLSKGTPAELKIEAEVEKLTQRLETLKTQMEEIRTRREEQVLPLRQRSSELRDKLKLVDSQIDSSQCLRERTGSRFDLQSSTSFDGSSNNHPDPDENGDFSPSSPEQLQQPPPAYSPYWKD